MRLGNPAGHTQLETTMLPFFSPEAAFRMFLVQFGNSAGHTQLETILSNLKITPEENTQLAAIIEIAYRHFQVIEQDSAVCQDKKVA